MGLPSARKLPPPALPGEAGAPFVVEREPEADVAASALAGVVAAGAREEVVLGVVVLAGAGSADRSGGGRRQDAVRSDESSTIAEAMRGLAPSRRGRPEAPQAASRVLVDTMSRRIYPRPAVAFDPTCVGFVTEPLSFSYDGDTLALYALGIGATRDELDFVYEGRGPRAFPTFAVIPAQPAVFACLGRTGGDFESVVHGAQSVRVLRAFPPQGTVETRATLAGLYDLKRLVQCVVRTESRVAGELVAETEWSILYRTGGGFGGVLPPKRTEPKPADGVLPDAEVVQETRPEQALLYRLSGDKNPLHADPALAAKVGFTDGPILHGLCTYGFAMRAIVRAFADGEPSRILRYDAQFKKPVWPGDVFHHALYREADGRGLIVTRARDVVVMTGSFELAV